DGVRVFVLAIPVRHDELVVRGADHLALVGVGVVRRQYRSAGEQTHRQDRQDHSHESDHELLLSWETCRGPGAYPPRPGLLQACQEWQSTCRQWDFGWGPTEREGPGPSPKRQRSLALLTRFGARRPSIGGKVRTDLRSQRRSRAPSVTLPLRSASRSLWQWPIP